MHLQHTTLLLSVCKWNMLNGIKIFFVLIHFACVHGNYSKASSDMNSSYQSKTPLSKLCSNQPYEGSTVKTCVKLNTSLEQ